VRNAQDAPHSDSYVLQQVGAEVPALSPEEVRALVRRMHQGDEAARDRLIGSQYRLILREARRVAGGARKPHLADDFFQVGLEALIQALDGFDPSRAALSTYTVMVSQRAMWRLVRKESRYELAEDILAKRTGASGDTSSDGDDVVELESDAISYLARAPHPDAELADRLTVLLPDDEAMILEGHVDGMTQEEMAESFGVSDRTVRRKQASAKGTLKAYVHRFGAYAAPVA
jgi:RNA polymerase sigma factor (sigma-70 family)